MDLVLLLGGVLVLTGLAIGWYGLRPLVVLPRLLRTTVVDPSEVDPDSSFAVCRGRADSTVESIRAPFTGRDCLGSEYEVLERSFIWTPFPLAWLRLDDGVATRAFDLVGDHGRVRVSPNARRFALDTESETIERSPGDELPDRIRAFIDARDELSPASEGLLSRIGVGSRRYIERRIDPDETYVIAGRPENGDDGTTVLTGQLVIADRSPRQIARRRVRTTILPIVAAVLFTVVGIGFLAL